MDKQTGTEQMLFNEQSARYSNESELPFSVPASSPADDREARNLEAGEGSPRPDGDQPLPR